MPKIKMPKLDIFYKRRDWFFWCALSLMILFRIWILSGIPKHYIFGPHDDLFFAKQAYSLLSGTWLGSFDEMILIKEPFYGMFLVVSSLSGLPLFLSENLLFILACLVFYIAIEPLIKNRWARLLMIAVLLFCPIDLLTYWTIRVYREFVYVSLSLLVISFAIGLFLRLKEKIWVLLLWAAGLGLSMGAFMLTREEGVWIYPVLFLLLLGGLWVIWKKSENHKWQRTGLIFLPVILWYIPLLLVSYMNYSYYGYWGTSSLLDPDLTLVISTMQRIRTNTWYPYQRVTRESLLKAYQVSPTLASLRAPLELSLIKWTPASQQLIQMKPSWYLRAYSDHGSEGGMSNIIWALPEAVSNAGYYSNGSYPHEVYARIARELTDACDRGALDCATSMNIPLIGTVEARQFPIIARMYVAAEQTLMSLDIGGLPEIGDPNYWGQYSSNIPEFSYFDMVANNPVMQPQTLIAIDGVSLNGWGFFEKSATPISFVFLDQAGNQLGDNGSANLPSPDVYQYFQQQGQNLPVTANCRFRLNFPKSTTQIKVVSSQGTTILPLERFASLAEIVQDGFQIFIDSRTSTAAALVKENRLGLLSFKKSYFLFNQSTYRALTLPFSLVGILCLLGLLVLSVWKKLHPPWNTWSSSFSWLVCCLRG